MTASVKKSVSPRTTNNIRSNTDNRIQCSKHSIYLFESHVLAMNRTVSYRIDLILMPMLFAAGKIRLWPSFKKLKLEGFPDRNQ